MLKIINVLALAVLTLSSCGFKALYKDESLSPYLNTIHINNIDSVEGSELCLHLSNLLPLTRKPLYSLKISFSFTSSPTAIQRNANITREDISQIIKFDLINISSGEIVMNGNFRHITSYNSTFTPYGSHVEREFAASNLTKYAAEEIRRRIILYFMSVKK